MKEKYNVIFFIMVALRRVLTPHFKSFGYSMFNLILF